MLPAATIALATVSTIVGACAQQQAQQRPAQAQPAEPAKDYNQRALEIYEFRKAAQSGPARGQEIYYYKCWMSHNELAKGGAPKLGGMFKRTTLVTGDPLNEETVRNQIRNGSANMPAYKHVLNDADLNDLVSWLHDEKCCWNSDAPPLNPRYKGSAAAPAQSLYGALTGGPKGLVKNARGEPIEGIMVQLIAEPTAIRATVFSHPDGRYEFPRAALARDKRPESAHACRPPMKPSSRTGWPRRAGRMRRIRTSWCSRARRDGRRKWSSPNTKCRASTSRRTTRPAMRKAGSGTRPTAAPMWGGLIPPTGMWTNFTCRCRRRVRCRAPTGSSSTRRARSGAPRTGRTISGQIGRASCRERV